MSRVRLILESIIFSTLIYLAVILFMVIQGQMLTRKYVPDVISNYSNVEYLQTEVSFGVINTFSLWIYLIGFIVLCSLYGTIRWLISSKWKSGDNA